MPIEALAMIGAEYTECAIQLKVWEDGGFEQTPPYLVAEQNANTIPQHSTIAGRIEQNCSIKKKPPLETEGCLLSVRVIRVNL
ncbi:hypothetical protein ACOSQ3_022053 [Xanthoceras sorbifolium]